MMNSTLRNWLLLLVIFVVVLGVDQVSKNLIIERLAIGDTVVPIEALSPFFQLTRSFNTGAAFGFLPNASDIFLVIAIVVVLSMFYFYPRIPADATATRVGVALVCGGAVGNALDRLQHGHVVDFIHYQIPGLISNVSNLADHAIVLGVVIILIDSWRAERQQKKNEAAQDKTPKDEAGDKAG